jgi:hypothetical protein
MLTLLNSRIKQIRTLGSCAKSSLVTSASIQRQFNAPPVFHRMRRFFPGAILLASLFCTLACHGQNSLTNGLVGWYPFNGNVNDASDQRRDGTIEGQIGFVPGISSGSAAWFPGTGAYVTLPGTLGITSDLTIAFWLKTSVVDYNNFPWCTFLVSRDLYAPAQDWNILVGNGRKLLFHTGDDVFGQQPLATPADLPSNSWVHVACIADAPSGMKRIFINGEQAAASTWNPVSFLNTGLPIYVGASTVETEFHKFYQGALADLRLFDRALTAEEVAEVSQVNPPARVQINKAVWISFSRLSVGVNYQVQVSSSSYGVFANSGAPFAATNSCMSFPVYWKVDDWSSLFFRLQTVP